MNAKRTPSTLMILCFVVPISVLILVGVILVKINSRVAKIQKLKKTFIEDKFKQIEKNESAARLEELTIKLGIDLVPKYSKGLHASEAQRERFEHLKTALSSHVTDQLSKKDPKVDPIPQELLSYYKDNESSIQQIINFLLSNPTPVWSVQPLDLVQKWPNLTGLLYLQRLLVTDSLYKMKNNRYNEAEQTLAALHNLNKNLLDRPESLSQSIAFHGVRLQLGLIRKGIRSEQHFEVLTHNYRDPYFDALKYEAIHMALYILGDKDFQKMVPGLYIKAVAGDSIETRLQRIEILKSLQGCVDAPKSLDDVSPAGWNFMDSLESVPGSKSKDLEGWKRYTDTMAHIDLTSKIINLRNYYNQNQQWPISLPLSSESKCPNALWDYQITEDNAAEISINNVPLPEKGMSQLLSRKYRLIPN